MKNFIVVIFTAVLMLLSFDSMAGNNFSSQVMSNGNPGHDHCDPDKPVGHDHSPGPGNGNGHNHDACPEDDDDDDDDNPPLEPDTVQPTLLGNISTRAFVMDGPAKVVGGFIVRTPAGAENTNLCVVIRGRGQSVGLPNAEILLPDPQLSLWTRIEGVQTVIAYNNDWEDDLDSAFNILNSGFGDVMEPTDAGIYICLPPGGYTAHLTSADERDGIGIVEVFDAENYLEELDTVSDFDDSDDLD
jgi:hypothetical protein